jgi:hypothetical protein
MVVARHKSRDELNLDEIDVGALRLQFAAA